MICPDCEQEVDKVYKSTGTCKKCYERMQNLKYNKKEYVPIKELKHTKPEVYNRLMARRKNKPDYIIEKEPKQKRPYNRKATATISSNIMPTQDDIVQCDINKSFEKRGIKMPKDTTSILPIFMQLDALLNNYIRDYINAEDILNKMELDYKHSKEYYTSVYKELYKKNPLSEECLRAKMEKDIREERHSCLLEKRRGIKRVLTEYHAGGCLFTELSQDTVFMKKFKGYYDNLQKICAFYDDKKYRAEASELVAQEEFCIGFKSDTSADGKHKYHVSVKTQYGNNVSSFNKNDIWAKDEADAKAQFIDIVRKGNYGFGFKPIDVVAVRLDKEGL